MKKILVALGAALGTLVCAQVGIGTTTLADSEILSIAPKVATETKSRGVLVPRVALTSESDVTTVPNPATFLVVYNTTNNSTLKKGFYYFNGVTNLWERAYDKTAVLELIVPAKNEISNSASGASQVSGTGTPIGYNTGLGTGEPPNSPWTALPGMTKSLNLYSAQNNLTVTASGMLQLNNTAAGSANQSHSYAIGLFVDGHLYSVRTFVATGRNGMTCLAQSWDIKSNFANLPAGPHNFEVYVRTRSNLAGNATTLTWVDAASGCSNINQNMAKGVLSVQSQQF